MNGTATGTLETRQTFALEMLSACFRTDEVGLSFMEASLTVTHCGEGLFPEFVYNVYAHQTSGAIQVVCTVQDLTHGMCSFAVKGHVFEFHCTKYGDSMLVEAPDRYEQRRLLERAVRVFLASLAQTGELVAAALRPHRSVDTMGLMGLIESIFAIRLKAEKEGESWSLYPADDDDLMGFHSITDLPPGVIDLLERKISP